MYLPKDEFGTRNVVKFVFSSMHFLLQLMNLVSVFNRFLKANPHVNWQ